MGDSLNFNLGYNWEVGSEWIHLETIEETQVAADGTFANATVGASLSGVAPDFGFASNWT